MLVLTRKIRESIVIDGNITVTVNRLTGNSVQLGIEAPAKINVIRQELVGRADQAPVVDVKRVS